MCEDFRCWMTFTPANHKIQWIEKQYQLMHHLIQLFSFTIIHSIMCMLQTGGNSIMDTAIEISINSIKIHMYAII